MFQDNEDSVNEEKMEQKKFRLYWLHRKSEVVSGETVEKAFSTAGYGAGAIRALDFFSNGEDFTHTWNDEKHDWVPIKQFDLTGV